MAALGDKYTSPYHAYSVPMPVLGTSHSFSPVFLGKHPCKGGTAIPLNETKGLNALLKVCQGKVKPIFKFRSIQL